MAAMRFKIPKGASVDDWADGLPEPQRGTVRELRRLIKRAVPEAQEVVKWSWPWYVVNDNVAAIMVTGDHVNIELARGADLADPSGVLEGTGKGMRHVKLRSARDVRELPVERLLREAAAVDARRG